MAHLARIVINWTGFAGAPGYTNLYFRNSTPGIITQLVVDNARQKVDAWLTSALPLLPATVTVGVDNTVGVIDDANGELQGYMTTNATAPRAGSGTGNYSAASGLVVNWSTGTVRNGRRIRGRMFMVPLAGSALSTNGSLDDANLPGIRAAAEAVRAASGESRLVVWARPTTPGGTDGGSAEVITSTIPDKVAVLTSRRD